MKQMNITNEELYHWLEYYRKERNTGYQRKVFVLEKWAEANIDDPYPNASTQAFLANQAGLDVSQVGRWFKSFRFRQTISNIDVGSQNFLDSWIQANRCTSYPDQAVIQRLAIQAKTSPTNVEYWFRFRRLRKNPPAISDEAKILLNNWLDCNMVNPYPNQTTRRKLAEETNMAIGQLDAWFRVARRERNLTQTSIGQEEKSTICNWIDSHKENPYASFEDITELVQKTKLSRKTVLNSLEYYRKKKGLAKSKASNRKRKSSNASNTEKNISPITIPTVSKQPHIYEAGFPSKRLLQSSQCYVRVCEIILPYLHMIIFC